MRTKCKSEPCLWNPIILYIICPCIQYCNMISLVLLGSRIKAHFQGNATLMLSLLQEESYCRRKVTAELKRECLLQLVQQNAQPSNKHSNVSCQLQHSTNMCNPNVIVLIPYSIVHDHLVQSSHFLTAHYETLIKLAATTNAILLGKSFFIDLLQLCAFQSEFQDVSLINSC